MSSWVMSNFRNTNTMAVTQLGIQERGFKILALIKLDPCNNGVIILFIYREIGVCHYNGSQNTGSGCKTPGPENFTVAPGEGRIQEGFLA